MDTISDDEETCLPPTNNGRDFHSLADEELPHYTDEKYTYNPIWSEKSGSKLVIIDPSLSHKELQDIILFYLINDKKNSIKKLYIDCCKNITFIPDLPELNELCCLIYQN